jgi:hypothetical protein
MVHMRAIISSTLLCVTIVSMLVPMQAFPQAPGSGWALVPTPERTIKTLYWELFDETEIWMRIAPEAEDRASTARIPASLIFWLTYPGKAFAANDIKTSPQEVMVQAQPDPLTIVNTLSLLFLVDDKVLFDLMGKGAAFDYIYPCPGCAPNAAVAHLDPQSFRRMVRSLVRSKTVTGEELGLKFRLSEADLQALRDFALYIKLPID